MSITTVVFTPGVWWLYEYNDSCLYPRVFGAYMSITTVVFTPGISTKQPGVKTTVVILI
jgi:hypothetical protein